MFTSIVSKSVWHWICQLIQQSNRQKFKTWYHPVNWDGKRVQWQLSSNHLFPMVTPKKHSNLTNKHTKIRDVTKRGEHSNSKKWIANLREVLNKKIAASEKQCATREEAINLPFPYHQHSFVVDVGEQRWHFQIQSRSWEVIVALKGNLAIKTLSCSKNPKMGMQYYVTLPSWKILCITVSMKGGMWALQM